jgi:SAM-dependent methyltransferase
VLLAQRLRRIRRPAWLGTIRRTQPLSDSWGRDRGHPIDRHYVERFLAENRAAITGRVVEIADRRYTVRFGSDVTTSDVLDVDAGNREANLVADLCDLSALPADAYDCAIVTQTLQYIYDIEAAVRGIHRLLRPSGVALVTVPAVSRVAHSAGVDGDFWRFTHASCATVFGSVFAGPVEVRTRGNVLVAVAFLIGMAREELSVRELELDDPNFPVLVTIRAQKQP